MKARVKATDRIIEVMCVMNREGATVWEDIGGISTNPNQYNSNELEFLDFPEMPIETYTPDYWTRLEHQYAGMAMQGILSNANHALWDRENNAEGIAKSASAIAHALVEKYKKEENNG